MEVKPAEAWAVPPIENMEQLVVWGQTYAANRAVDRYRSFRSSAQWQANATWIEEVCAHGSLPMRYDWVRSVVAAFVLSCHGL